MKSAFMLLSAITALISLSAHADQASDYAAKTFKDWTVACNNQRVCSASSLLAPADDAPNADEISAVALTIERGAAADSPAKLSLIASGDEAWEEKQVGEALGLDVGEQSFEFGKLTQQQVADLKIDLPAEQVADVLAAAQKASTIKLLIGSTEMDVSVSGLSASLLYMDEQQQRLDTPTALINKGNKNFTASLPKIPSVTPIIQTDEAGEELADVQAEVLATARKLSLPAVKNCNAERQAESEDTESMVALLDTKNYLIGLNCGSGAYNSTTLLLVAPKDHIEQAKLAQLDQGTDGDALLTGYTSYESSTGLLHNLYKSRGLGDCGTDADWAWTGKQFSLVRLNVMEECRGNMNFLNVWQLDLAKPKSE